jgi:hypothetical protein
METFLTVWVIAYLIVFAFLVYQDWRLKDRLESPAWWWEIAGVTLAFLGVLARFLLSYWQLTSREVLTLALAFNSLAALICLTVSRHLLHRSLERLFKAKR